jgi:ABC-type transporter Mla subunit MlaD
MASKETKVKSDEQKNDSKTTQDTPDLGALLEALEGDVTALDSEAAIAVIDQWEAALKNTKDESLKEVSSSLKELKKLLKSKSPDASKLGEVLTKLGEQTTEAAAEAERGTKGQLQKVGKALSKVGQSLDSESELDDEDLDDEDLDDEDDGTDLESLLEVLEGDVTQIDPEEAIEVIDEWHEALKGTKDEGLKAVNHSLTELKKLLKSKKADPAKLAEVLTQLSHHTDQAADSAERGTKGQLREASKAIGKIAKSVEKAES